MSAVAGGGGNIGEVFRYFLRLGFIAFGGPAAHIALMRRELVVQKRWVSDEQFIDLIGVTNLIPGPNSTEMTMHLGGQRHVRQRSVALQLAQDGAVGAVQLGSRLHRRHILLANFCCAHLND